MDYPFLKSVSLEVFKHYDGWKYRIHDKLSSYTYGPFETVELAWFDIGQNERIINFSQTGVVRVNA